MNKKRLLIFLGTLMVIIIVATVIFFRLQASGQMTFPKTPHGVFTQAPKMINENGTKKITWVLPESCVYNSYEAQEVGYTPDSEMFWGGGERIPCRQQEDGYYCETNTHPDLQGIDQQWRIQASAYECTSGAHYLSEVVTVN